MKAYPVQVLFREYFEGILAAVFLALFLRFFVVSVLYIPTDNMEPGLKRGDFVLGWRLAYGFPLPLMKGERLNSKMPARGDVISFRFPGDDEQIIIRRVIGLPGDEVAIRSGQLFLNGKEIPRAESSNGTYREKLTPSSLAYPVLESTDADMDKMVVPNGNVFVLSDNRLRSDDSRDWGTVPKNNIESRLLLIWLSVSNEQEGLEIHWPRIFSRVR